MSALTREKVLPIILKLGGLWIFTYMFGVKVGVLSEQEFLENLDTYVEEHKELGRELFNNFSNMKIDQIFEFLLKAQEDVIDLVKELVDQETKGEEQA